MKNILLLLAMVFSFNGFTQIYPYSENFSGMANNQIPTAWVGSMKVKLNHGTNDGYAVVANMSGVNHTDSIITPLIGPLTASSSLTFFYRIIDQNIYPSTPTYLITGDVFQVELTTNNAAYQTILQIDENNHNPSFNFKKQKVFIQTFPGDTVHLKFRSDFATGNAFFIDIDSIVVQNDPQIGIEEAGDDENVLVYPNPNSIGSWQLAVTSEWLESTVEVSEPNGKVVFKSAIRNPQSAITAENLSSGIYFLRISAAEKFLTRKLMVE